MKIKNILFLIVFISFSQIQLFAESETIENAVRFLSTSKPMIDPQIDTERLDISVEARKSAQELLAIQMKALDELRGSKNTEVVNILIPYLHYSIDLTPPYMHSSDLKKPKPELADLIKKWPAFAVILNIPNSAIPLKEYCLNPKNPIDRRLATFLVLRYIDSDKFQSVATILDHEFSNAGPQFKLYLKGIENGNTQFMGVYPIRASD